MKIPQIIFSTLLVFYSTVILFYQCVLSILKHAALVDYSKDVERYPSDSDFLTAASRHKKLDTRDVENT